MVLFEDGLIPARRELFLPLPISTSSGDFRTFTVAVPYYDNRASDGARSPCRWAGVAQTSELVRLEALAAKDLQERLPGMLTRQALRLVAKEQVRRTAARRGMWATSWWGSSTPSRAGGYPQLADAARQGLELAGDGPGRERHPDPGGGQRHAYPAAQRPRRAHHPGWVQRLGSGLTTRVMPSRGTGYGNSDE